MKLKSLALASAACALLLGVGTANAYKLDISAVSGLTTDVALPAGTYVISWLGRADGAAYDAWSYNTAPSGNWRNAFTVDIAGSIFTVDKPTATPFANFETAGAALDAFKSGDYRVYASTAAPSYQPAMMLGDVAAPTFTLDAPTALKFGVPDYLLSDNSGGVSLQITPVPEPATVALMLAGLGAVGVTASRRKARQA